jgi:hypothetical protein
MKINCIGAPFSHAHSSTWWKKSNNIEWIHKCDSTIPLQMYIDHGIIHGLDRNSKNKFAWLLESRSIFDSQYLMNRYEQFVKSFELIFTHNTSLIKLNPEKFKYVPANGYWIETPKIYDKSKVVSMVTSLKKFTTGHNKRFEIMDKFRFNIDLFGRGLKEIKLKEEGLNEYMFSFAIENDKYDTYFTEKILDCFATGTIPIYWGTDKISEYFNKDGIIMYDENFDIKKLTKEYYYDNIKAIEDNYNRVLEYEIPEDIIYKKYLCNYE